MSLKSTFKNIKAHFSHKSIIIFLFMLMLICCFTLRELFPKERFPSAVVKGAAQESDTHRGDDLTFKVLVLCHPRKFYANPRHWSTSDIEGVIKKYNVHSYPVTIFTADRVQHKWQTQHADYLADVFSEEFIESHPAEFDLVFVPDCAGPWDVWQNASTRKRFLHIKEDMSDAQVWAQLKTFLSALLYTVKDNGRIVFTKLLSGVEIQVQRDPDIDRERLCRYGYYYSMKKHSI